jgi:two-component system, OmpR family, phosphate regulon response regulator PhoB
VEKTPAQSKLQKILVVDDEPDVVELLSYHLKNAGYRVRTVTNATTSIERARSFQPDLVILDIMMPELNGTQICRILRSDPEMKNVPIIFLTARGDEADRVRGFEAGCDDYVSKPFSVKEVVLRVKSNLRRAGKREIVEVKQLQVGKIMLDLERHKASVGGRRVELTLTEFKLLQLLMERLGHVLTRETLLVQVWNYQAEIETRTVDTFIRRLRQKLASEGARIETIRGVGYRMVERKDPKSAA